MRKVAIVGAGGINSWFAQHLSELIKIFGKDDLIFVKIFDDDVVEEKNLRRGNQNYLPNELMEKKAQALAKRLQYDFNNVFITEANINLLDNFDDIIIGVDSHKVRRLIYDYAIKNKKYVLDMRAQGTQIGFTVLDNKKTIEYYDKTIFKNNLNRKGSCQLASDIDNDHIENGNRIIAFMGAYGIYMKHLRDEEPNAKEYKFAY